MTAVQVRHDAQGVKHLETITVGGTWLAGETCSVTINTKTLTFTVVSGATDITDVIAGMLALLQASTAPGEFQQITWASTSTTITGTGKTDGQHHTISVAETSVSGTFTDATTTTADGPKNVTAANMSGAALPSASDTLGIENSSVDLLYDLDALSGTTLAKTEIKSSYLGNIGLERQNGSGSTAYEEYLPRFLQLNSTELLIGQGDGAGSSRLLIDLEAVQSAVEVLKTANSNVDGLYALRIKGTHASNTLLVNGAAQVDIAPYDGDSATFLTLTVAAGTVRTSQRTTLGTVNLQGSGTLEIFSDAALSAITAINLQGSSTLTLLGDNAITTVTLLDGATLDDRGSGTITNLNKGPKANYTDENSAVAVGGRIITNTTLAAGSGKFIARKVTFTNAIDVGMANPLTDFQNMDIGANVDIQKS